MNSPTDGLPCDTEAGLLYLKQLFPVEKFHNTLPPLVLKHQVYSVIHDKTTVDREIVSCAVYQFIFVSLTLGCCLAMHLWKHPVRK